jgi:exodeoxyribonuclease VII large subunit
VQGDSAAAEIETALAELNASGLVDVVVLARGGGSLEDLAAFNSERVARAIVASRLPVISAVGHETDFTIADFAADLRAPTPSAAAEMITEVQHKIADRVDSQALRLERAARYQLLQAHTQLDRLPVERAEGRMTALLHRLDQRHDDLSFRLEIAVAGNLRRMQREVTELAAAVLYHDPRRRLGLTREHLAACRTSLDRSLERAVQSAATRVQSLDARLRTLSPLAVLDRGFALVQGAGGVLIRSTAQIAQGERITTRLSDGTFISQVESLAKVAHKTKSRKK